MIKKNSSKYASATSKYLRLSPTKINQILKKIRGKTYRDALTVLKFLPQKSGAIVWQTLYSAVSNGTNNFGLIRENINIHEAYVNQGPILKRMQARAKGRAFKIQKKMSHLTISIKESKNINSKNKI